MYMDMKLKNNHTLLVISKTTYNVHVTIIGLQNLHNVPVHVDVSFVNL